MPLAAGALSFPAARRRTAPRRSLLPTARLEMVRLALHSHHEFIVDVREVYRTDPCYTVDTLTSLRDELGTEQPLCLLLGSDAFLQLHTWHQWQRLFELAHIVVMQRPGRPLGNAMPAAPIWHCRPNIQHDWRPRRAACMKRRMA